MGIVISNYPLIVPVMQRQGVFYSMGNMFIHRRFMGNKFRPKSVIHWKHLTIKL